MEPQPDPVRTLVTIMSEAIRISADRVRVVPSEDRTRYGVMFAVNGNILDQPSLPDREGRSLIQRIKLMAGMNILDSTSLQSGRILFPQQPGIESKLWFVESSHRMEKV